MEQESPRHFDRHAARAAHRVYRNRQRIEVLQARLDRATTDVLVALALAQQTHAVMGLYDVMLDDDETLRVTPLPNPDVQQLALPELAAHDRGATLSPEEHELLAQVDAGDVPCPWCATALHGSVAQLGAHATVHLRCPSPACGFEEF